MLENIGALFFLVFWELIPKTCKNQEVFGIESQKSEKLGTFGNEIQKVRKEIVRGCPALARFFGVFLSKQYLNIIAFTVNYAVNKNIVIDLSVKREVAFILNESI